MDADDGQPRLLGLTIYLIDALEEIIKLLGGGASVDGMMTIVGIVC